MARCPLLGTRMGPRVLSAFNLSPSIMSEHGQKGIGNVHISALTKCARNPGAFRAENTKCPRLEAFPSNRRDPSRVQDPPESLSKVNKPHGGRSCLYRTICTHPPHPGALRWRCLLTRAGGETQKHLQSVFQPNCSLNLPLKLMVHHLYVAHRS